MEFDSNDKQMHDQLEDDRYLSNRKHLKQSEYCKAKRPQLKKIGIGNLYLHIQTRTLPINYPFMLQNHDLYDYLMCIYDMKPRIDLFNFTLNQKYLFFYRDKLETNQSQHVVIEKSPIKKKYPSYQKGIFLFGALLKKRNQNYYLKILQANQINIEHLKVKPNLEELAYQIVRMSISEQSDCFKQQGVKLKLGQVIRMGKSQYRIISIKFGSQKQQIRISNQIQMKSISPNQEVYKYRPIQPEEGQENITICCRICFSGDQPSQVGDKIDFLINPCKCKGTAKYIHFQCLLEWMKSRVMRNQVEGAIQYNFKRYQCELCKTPYPRYFQFEQKVIQMVPVTKPIQEHIMFQGMNEQSISLLIIQKFNNPVKMGRNITNDIIMQDMSVSRNHSEIIKKSDGFYILDDISKFGTLVMDPQMEIQLSKNRRAIQVGHSVFCFNLMQSEDGFLPQPQNINNGYPIIPQVITYGHRADSTNWYQYQNR